MASKVPKVDVSDFLAASTGATKPSKKKAIPELDCPALADLTYAAYVASKDAEATFKALESQVVELTSAAYAQHAQSGEFTKSLNIPGTTSAGVQVSYKDQFSAIPIEQEPDLKEALGEKFDTYFEQKRDLSLVDTSDETIQLLIKKLGPDEFRRIFAIKITLTCKADMDRKQFELPVAATAIIKQYKPALKILK